MKSTLGVMMALALITTGLSPGAAYARDNRHYGRYHQYYDSDRRRGNGDAVAAGVIGLALGAMLGAAISERHRHHRCDYGCGYSDGGYYDGGYYGRGYYGGDGYSDGYYSEGRREEYNEQRRQEWREGDRGRGDENRGRDWRGRRDGDRE